MKLKKKHARIMNNKVNIMNDSYLRLEGIYISDKTGRIFEAIKDGHGMIISRYCDNDMPEFGAVINECTFAYFYAIGIYEDVINYYDEGI